jgi:hypothetical protein
MKTTINLFENWRKFLNEADAFGHLDDDGVLDPDELRTVADELEQRSVPLSMEELGSYMCFQLDEVWEQQQEALTMDEETFDYLERLRDIKNC